MKTYLFTRNSSVFKYAVFQSFVFLAAAFIFVGTTATVKAQDELNTLWKFVYTERALPAPNWGCPYAICDADNPPSKTRVAYASDYTYWIGNRAYNHLNKNLSATFTKGDLMGGVWQGQQCQYGMWGYGTSRYGNIGESCSSSSNEITVTFSQPIRGDSITISGKYPQTLILTESGQPSQTITMSRNFDYPPEWGYGQETVNLSGRKITSLKIRSEDEAFAFSIEDIQAYATVVSSPNSNNPPPNHCNVTPTERPAPQNISSHQWTMNAEVSDREGLVLSDIRLKGRMMADRISVPYYQLLTDQTALLRGELRPNDSSGELRSRLVSYKTEINDERLIVEAVYAIDNISAAQSCLTITQRYEFLREGLYGPCTPPAPGPLSWLPVATCSRWRASVNYNFKSAYGENFRSINVAQRNHFKVNGFERNSVALFQDCDIKPNSTSLGCTLSTESGGPVFKNKLNPLFSETYSSVILEGKRTKQWDNIHQSYLGDISEPGDNVFSSHFSAAGCPECLHSHWRWGRHFGEHFNSGEPFLRPGSIQNQDIAIVRYRAGEERPQNFKDLVSDSERIRLPLTGSSTSLDHFQAYNYSVPMETVYWLSATSPSSGDSFFDYYSFFIPSVANVTKPISSNPLFSQNNKSENNSLTGVDAPASIDYGFLYTDGATTYTERDPNMIAQLPNAYAYYSNIAYDVRTEASVSGPHTITFDLPSVADQTTFDSLRVLHSEPDPFDPTKAVWVDRTILSPNAPAPDYANRKISAKVSEVGPFVIARLVNPPAPNTNIADLSVTLAESADPIVAGNDLIYTINVTNDGPDAATGVALSNGLSPDVSFVSADAGQKFCNHINGTVMCNLDTIASGATIPVTVTVKPNEGQTRFPAEGKSLVNTIFVVGNEADPNEADNSISETTIGLPNPNAPPTIEIQSPSREYILSDSSNFTVIIDATDEDGYVAQVELFDNTVSAGTGTLVETGKYSVDLSNLSLGEHSLIAIVTDDGGRKAVSDSVGIFVNGPAKISLDSPEDGVLFARPANIALTATAVNDGGTISQVEFFANGEKIGNGTLSGTNQYNFTWSNAPTGRHSVQAIATDGNGIKSRSFATLIFVTEAPSVNITSPASGGSYPKGSSVTFTATAKDFDSYVSKVDFLRNDGNVICNGTLVQGNIYNCVWDPSSIIGTFTITAVATDNWGKTSVSNPVTVTFTNSSPSVSLTAPANEAAFTTPANITISADASDGDGWITKVEFFRGTTKIGTSTAEPYSVTWNGATAGSYSLTARATDNDGAVTTSSPISITVNPTGDALFVVGSTTLSSVDSAIKTRLQNLGLNVIVKSATAAVSADATGKRVVVISDSVTPTNVNTKFRTVSVPVVTLEPQLFDDMGMTATASTNFGTTTNQKNVSITNASHPMAAGLSGTVQVTSANTTFNWGVVNANAAKIATLTTDATKATNFGYEANAVMPGLTAPKRRVGFFYSASSATLTANGGLLFDNAIKWAAGL